MDLHAPDKAISRSPLMYSFYTTTTLIYKHIPTHYLSMHFFVYSIIFVIPVIFDQKEIFEIGVGVQVTHSRKLYYSLTAGSLDGRK